MYSTIVKLNEIVKLEQLTRHRAENKYNSS